LCPEAGAATFYARAFGFVAEPSGTLARGNGRLFLVPLVYAGVYPLSRVTLDASVERMTISWNVRDRATAKGWTNAHQLALGAGISYPIAWRIMGSDAPLERIETATLAKLARAFGLKTPWALLRVEP
jgi:hypothetical protein